MKKIFGVVVGPRLGGKSTLVGTLPGKTVMLQAAVHESGSRSAKALARKRGNTLVVEDFTDLVDLRAKLAKHASDPTVDHIYIDGFTALTDMRFAEPDIQKVLRADNFAGYRKLGDDMVALVIELKGYTYAKYNKNVFVTVAAKMSQRKASEPLDCDLEAKGNMGVTAITKLGEVVISVLNVPTSEGGSKRVVITKDGFYEKWPGRIDGVLDEDNTGYCEPDLGIVMNMAQAAYDDEECAA